MTLDEAEKFATEADILNADLEYVEAASKSNVITAGSSVPRPLVASELRPELQEEIKEIQKRKKRRKIKVQVDRAKEVAEEEKAAAEGPAAPEERALQEEKLTQEGSAIKEMKAPQRKAPAAAPNPKPEIGYTSADDAAILTPKGENKTWEDIGKIGLRFRYKELMAQNGGDTALAATQEGRAAIEKSTTPAERSVQADSAPKKEALQVEKAVEVEAAAKRQVMQDVEAPQEQQAAKETTKVVRYLTIYFSSLLFQTHPIDLCYPKLNVDRSELYPMFWLVRFCLPCIVTNTPTVTRRVPVIETKKMNMI